MATPTSGKTIQSRKCFKSIERTRDMLDGIFYALIFFGLERKREKERKEEGFPFHFLSRSTSVPSGKDGKARYTMTRVLLHQTQ